MLILVSRGPRIARFLTADIRRDSPAFVRSNEHDVRSNLIVEAQPILSMDGERQRRSKTITFADLGPGDWVYGPHGLRLSVSRRRALAGDRDLELTKTTFDVLALLLRRAGEVVTVEELVREVWGYSDVGRPGFARTAVYRLRKELKSAGIGDLIEAVRGVGFRIADAGDRAALAFDPENALMSATTAIIVVNPDRRVMWANQAAERLLGYDLEELRALDSTSELAGGSDPKVYERFRELIWSGQTLQGPSRTRRKDGTIIELPSSWKPIFDSQGNLQYTIFEVWTEVEDDGVVRRAS